MSRFYHFPNHMRFYRSGCCGVLCKRRQHRFNQRSLDGIWAFSLHFYFQLINLFRQTYTANVFFAQKWKDSRLRFPNNMTYEYRILDVKWLDEIWRPDSYFKNAKSVQFSTVTVPNHYIWLYRDKTIFYMMKLSLTLSCAMNFAIYPHDTQVCKMQIESCKWSPSDIHLTILIECIRFSVSYNGRIGV